MRGKHLQNPLKLRLLRITPAHAGKTAFNTRRTCISSDHPRACGENRLHVLIRGESGGSPPRMRGKPVHCVADPALDRITPAHAGKTAGVAALGTGIADHPRACGENFVHRLAPSSIAGSPPRMRGKRPRGHLYVGRARITPAHAGKTSPTYALKLLMTDHPRACGENFSFPWKRDPTFGSPPRMRGKLLLKFRPNVIRRITPAHAGKTSETPPRITPLSDHPRACGENGYGGTQSEMQRGSPPRMRGKQFVEGIKCDCNRITPAHAGKTAGGMTGVRGGADHPRACGENMITMMQLQQDSGSPPRMRGKLGVFSVAVWSARITPAHAGKTEAREPGRLEGTDHPRACGENPSTMVVLHGTSGSPPRMRGKLLFHSCSLSS